MKKLTLPFIITILIIAFVCCDNNDTLIPTQTSDTNSVTNAGTHTAKPTTTTSPTRTISPVDTGTKNVISTGTPATTIRPTATGTPTANITYRNLSISPEEVRQGRAVTISIVVTNTGGRSGRYAATLKINGNEIETKRGTLHARERKTVSFEVTMRVSRTYRVDVNGLRGLFVVTEIQPEPSISLDVDIYCDCSQALYDCTDFPTQAAAQRCYEHCLSITDEDIHQLDRNNDGNACEYFFADE